MFGFGKSNKKSQDGYTQFVKASPRKLAKQFDVPKKEVKQMQAAAKKAGRKAWYE